MGGYASVAWPLAMIAIAEATGQSLEEVRAFLAGEIAAAHWFHRDEVRSALELGDWASDSDSRLLLPGSISIARGMLEAWAASRS